MEPDTISTIEQVRLWCSTIDNRIDPPLYEAMKRQDLEGAGRWMDRRVFAHERLVTTF